MQRDRWRDTEIKADRDRESYRKDRDRKNEQRDRVGEIH